MANNSLGLSQKPVIFCDLLRSEMVKELIQRRHVVLGQKFGRIFKLSWKCPSSKQKMTSSDAKPEKQCDKDHFCPAWSTKQLKLRTTNSRLNNGQMSANKAPFGHYLHNLYRRGPSTLLLLSLFKRHKVPCYRRSQQASLFLVNSATSKRDIFGFELARIRSRSSSLQQMLGCGKCQAKRG